MSNSDGSSPSAGSPEDRALSAELDGALSRGEIEVMYQPQIDVVSGHIVAAEALSRWRHPVRGIISPDVFIPLAETSGAIQSIGLFMLDAACAFASDLRRDGHTIDVSVNVSAKQLTTPSFFRRVAENVKDLALRAGAVTIEITESQAITDVAAVSARLNHLRHLGLGISIDDFGTGHSSFAQLESLPVTELKIDRTLLRNTAASGRALITALVALGLDRGLRVVMEGVETDADMTRVRDLHCSRAQGFLMGRPMSRLDLDVLIAADAA